MTQVVAVGRRPFFLTHMQTAKLTEEKGVTSWGESSSSRAVSNQLVISRHMLSVVPGVERAKRKLRPPVGKSPHLRSFIIMDRHMKWPKNSGERCYQQVQNNKIYSQAI